MVQFVPLHFKLERDTEIGSLEKDNGLPAGSVLRAKWIKPAYRRSPDQTCGHLILVASKPETANKILTDGLIICQKRVYAEKCKKEPTRCLKCHGWGHLSYDCKQAYDTCGMCADRHRMASCTNGRRLRCVSCWVEGHASWDQQCPIFVRKCEEMGSRLTKNSMPYFPTAEPWTHVVQPPKPVYQPAPRVGPSFDPVAGPSRPAFRQSTLPFAPSQRRPHGGLLRPPSGPPAANDNTPATGLNSVMSSQPSRWFDQTGDDGLPSAAFS